MGSWTSKPRPPRIDWFKGCVGKRSLSEKQALSEAERIGREKNIPILRTYHCPFCGNWHLTSSKKKGEEVT